MILDFLIALIVFGIIITIVIFSHELGHFIGAKITKTKVIEFAVGFPPFIWKKKIDETLFLLGIVPFGGYNKIYGMDVEAEEKEDASSYTSKRTREKILIIILGVVGNIILSIFLFYIFLGFSGFSTYVGLINDNYRFPLGNQENYIYVSYVEPESVAANGGLEEGEIIISIDGQSVENGISLENILQSTKGEKLDILVRNKKTQEEKFVEIQNTEEKLGIGFSEITKLDYSNEEFFSGFMHFYNITDYSLNTMGYVIEQSFAQKDASIAGQAVAGPIGIFAITKISLNEGFLQIINITAIISLALAITNLLPLPALDGGKCIYLFLQKLNSKIFTEKLSERIDQIGFILLIILAILILIKDVFQFKDIIF